MKSANNELTTARNTPNPTVAAGKGNAPVRGKSSMAPIGASKNSIVMLTARFPKRRRATRGLVLRHEILLGARHAVIVGPAIDLSVTEIKSGRINDAILPRAA